MHRRFRLCLSRPRLFLVFSLTAALLSLSAADVGSAASYAPPYLPTTCFRFDRSQFPADATLAAAGPGIWDNGAACGRRYSVRCLSSSLQAACITDATVSVTVVDESATLGNRQSSEGTTMALSLIAYRKIASLNASAINIEFAEL